MTHFYFIRHAESQANVDNHLICGQSNHIPLSDRGFTQSHLLAQRLLKEKIQFDHVYSSNAIRAKQTAETICEHLGMDTGMIQYSDQLLELSKGEWEGKVRKEIYTQELQNRIEQDIYDFRSPGGESQRDTEERMLSWLHSTLEKHREENAQIAVYSHGFAIKSLLIGLMKADPIMSYRLIVHNTSMTVIRHDDNSWLIERLNDYSHLQGTEFIRHYT